MTRDRPPLPADAPRQERRCPVCGEPNGCVPAATGSFADPCWCRELRFAPQVLARVPPALRGQACLCRRCAQQAHP